MWHWLRKKVHAIDYAMRLSISVACGIHLLFFLFFFVAHWVLRNTVVQINRQYTGLKAPVIIIDPRAQTPGLTHHNGTSGRAKKSIDASKQKEKTLVVQKDAPGVPVQKAKKPVVNSSKSEVKKLPQKKIEKKKEPVKKATLEKNITKPAPVKKKNNALKKPQQKAETIKKPKPIPVVEEEKKIEQAPVAEPVSKQGMEAVTPDDISVIEGPILIARSAQEAATLTIQLQLQEELLRVWHPPVGVDDMVSCKVRVVIDAIGVVQQIEMIKPSGMLLFDVSARAAVQQAVWPRGVWGTTLELVLQ